MEEGGGCGCVGGGRVGGIPTPGGPIGGEDVMADWWLGASIPPAANRRGPGGDTSPSLGCRSKSGAGYREVKHTMKSMK